MHGYSLIKPYMHRSCGELLILDKQLALVLFAWERNELPFCSWGFEEESG